VRGDGKQEVKEKGKKYTDKREKAEQGFRQESFKGINREL
jgi:hypothetical protein